LIAGLLRVLIKLAAAAAVVLLSLTLAGDYLHQLVPAQYHRAVSESGLLIFFPCVVGIVLMSQPVASRSRRFKNLLVVGAIIGALLFVLFITDVECTRTLGNRGRLDLSCRYLAEP
jgi:hypothetical protein